jgi:hypothetical protein
MAYTGSTTPSIGTDTSANLKRDITLDVLEAKERMTRFADLIRVDTLGEGASSGSFIVEGKEDKTNGNMATYPAGTQVNVNNGTQDEIIIALDRPQYESRRIDKWEQTVARYDTLSMNVRQLGARLANAIDRKCSAAIEASSLATGLVSNGNGTVVTNTALPAGAAAAATAELLGKEIIESIYAAVAAMRTNDVIDPVYVAMSPTNFQYLPQALTIVSSEYTSANGGLDIGDVKMVSGATVFTSNNLPTTAGLIAQAFTMEAAAMVKLWDVKVDINTQPDYLDAKLINAYFSNGVGALRPQCSVSIKNV